jgi:hypothetical protein
MIMILYLDLLWTEEEDNILRDQALTIQYFPELSSRKGIERINRRMQFLGLA